VYVCACNGRSSKVKARSYHSCAAFERDLALVVNNCRAYNEPESIYCTAAAELEKWGQKLFERLRNTDMLPPDEPTYSSDDDDSSSTDSSEHEDENDGGMVAGNSFVATADAGMSAAGAHANAESWRQSATAFLHGQPSEISAAAAQAAGRADTTADLDGGSSSASEDSSDDSDSSDGGVEDLNHGETGLSATSSGGPSVAGAPAPTGVVDHGLPRFTLGPKVSAPSDQGGADW
jgi:hypothetical protein